MLSVAEVGINRDVLVLYISSGSAQQSVNRWQASCDGFYQDAIHVALAAKLARYISSGNHISVEFTLVIVGRLFWRLPSENRMNDLPVLKFLRMSVFLVKSQKCISLFLSKSYEVLCS